MIPFGLATPHHCDHGTAKCNFCIYCYAEQLERKVDEQQQVIHNLLMEHNPEYAREIAAIEEEEAMNHEYKEAVGI